jgi:hypothetical protein
MTKKALGQKFTSKNMKVKELIPGLPTPRPKEEYREFFIRCIKDHRTKEKIKAPNARADYCAFAWENRKK